MLEEGKQGAKCSPSWLPCVPPAVGVVANVVFCHLCPEGVYLPLQSVHPSERRDTTHVPPFARLRCIVSLCFFFFFFFSCSKNSKSSHPEPGGTVTPVQALLPHSIESWMPLYPPLQSLTNTQPSSSPPSKKKKRKKKKEKSRSQNHMLAIPRLGRCGIAVSYPQHRYQGISFRQARSVSSSKASQAGRKPGPTSKILENVTKTTAAVAKATKALKAAQKQELAMSQIAKVFTSKAATAKAAKTKAATAKAKAKAAKAKAANAKAVKAAAAMAVKAKKSAKAKALQAAKFAKQAAKAKVAQAAQDKLAKQAAKTKTAKAKAAQAAKLAKQAAKAKAVQGKSAKAKAVQAAKFAKQAAKAKAAQAAQDKLAKQSAKTKTAKAKAAQAAKLAKQAAKAKALQKKVAKAKAVQAARDKLVKQAAKAKAVQAARDKAKQAAKAKAVQAARDKAKQAALQKKAAKTTTSQAAQKNLVQVAKAPRTATTTLKRISAPPKIRHMLARTQEKKARFEALVGSRLADLRKSAFENRTFPVVRTEQRYDFLRSTPNEPILHLIDASDWIYRSYFSIPQYLPNNAVHGFLRALILHVECMGPKDKLMLCFDSGRTWRNAEAPEYKTGRKSYPHLKKQLPLCRTAAQQLVGVKHCMSVVGMEADDIIAEIAKTSDCKVAIHANDQDFLQLVNDRVCLLRKKKDEQKQEHYHVFGANEVRNTFYGLHPSELCDYWALVGQPSDAIKGVAGVGPVKAADLILTLGNIKEVFNENRRYGVGRIQEGGASMVEKKW